MLIFFCQNKTDPVFLHYVPGLVNSVSLGCSVYLQCSFRFIEFLVVEYSVFRRRGLTWAAPGLEEVEGGRISDGLAPPSAGMAMDGASTASAAAAAAAASSTPLSSRSTTLTWKTESTAMDVVLFLAGVQSEPFPSHLGLFLGRPGRGGRSVGRRRLRRGRRRGPVLEHGFRFRLEAGQQQFGRLVHLYDPSPTLRPRSGSKEWRTCLIELAPVDAQGEDDGAQPARRVLQPAPHLGVEEERAGLVVRRRRLVVGRERPQVTLQLSAHTRKRSTWTSAALFFCFVYRVFVDGRPQPTATASVIGDHLL